MKYDDSIQDDSQLLSFNSSCSLFLYNYDRDVLTNLTSGSLSTQITGSNSLILKLTTEISGGWHTIYFTGSQHTLGIYPVAGIYSASFMMPFSTVLTTKLTQSGSIKFTPIWGSLDGTVAFSTGSVITVRASSRSSANLDTNRITISVDNLQSTYSLSDNTILRMNIFDINSPLIIASRLPVQLAGVVLRDVHYQIRELASNRIVIPFDTTYNSTRLSSDTSGMFFKLDMSNLVINRAYTIDALLVLGTSRITYKSVASSFMVEAENY